MLRQQIAIFHKLMLWTCRGQSASIIKLIAFTGFHTFGGAPAGISNLTKWGTRVEIIVLRIDCVADKTHKCRYRLIFYFETGKGYIPYYCTAIYCMPCLLSENFKEHASRAEYGDASFEDELRLDGLKAGTRVGEIGSYCRFAS